MTPLTLGRLQVARHEEMIWTISPRFLFPYLEREAFEPMRDWLVPRFSNDELDMHLSIHTFVIRTPHHTVLVDTCLGNDKPRRIEQWNMLSTAWLENLRASGVDPERVDYVFCTHMHTDHVGWHTKLADGRWVPTFPNATYLFHETEWNHWRDTEEGFQAQVVKDSLEPIVDAGLAKMVGDDFAITDEIRLEPTPGHTPGHCSVHLAGGGSEAVITGDMIHHPSQVAHPEWSTRADTDPDLAARTRRDFLARYADTGIPVLGTHFAPPTAVRIAAKGDAFALEG